ncbi:hypothetical protein [Mycolicibacterium sp.]
MSNEITHVGSMRYPDEIVEVTKDLTANCQPTRASTPVPPTRSS